LADEADDRPEVMELCRLVVPNTFLLLNGFVELFRELKNRSHKINMSKITKLLHWIIASLSYVKYIPMICFYQIDSE